MAIIAIHVISNFAFAGNPENLGSKMIEKLNKDVQLTDSQKVILQVKATDFALKMQNAKSQTNTADISAIKKQANQEFKTCMDSLLTNDQKAKLTIRKNERRQAIIKKYKTNK